MTYKFPDFSDVPAHKVVCDETNNTPEDLERGILHVHIWPYKSLEYIPITPELNDSTPPS